MQLVCQFRLEKMNGLANQEVTVFDAHNGEIEFDDCPFRLSPALPVEEFLASPLSPGGDAVYTKDPWLTWRLPPHTLDQGEFAATLHFRQGHLVLLYLACVDPKFGKSWGEWSRENEAARKQFHDQWLTRSLGQPGGVWQWGSIESVSDQKAGCSLIIVRYGSEARQELRL